MGFYPINLEELREQKGAPPHQPFQHQIDAFNALTRTFDFTGARGNGGLLVLPTGAGKTFTAVKWLCDHVIASNIKILWFAHSFYLLDQALNEFLNYARWIPEPRKQLNIRIVSSNRPHDPPSSISEDDDVVIMTTQTAIKNLHLDASDIRGKRVVTKFRRFIDGTVKSGLFVVLDEAHHAPAYGCRNLLICDEKQTPGIRKLAPYANLLGLTATPTYSDGTRRGWLGRIFEKGIIYEADKAPLMAQGILARPKYIQRDTGKEMVVSEGLYRRLVREHKDLPEEIIEKLASDSKRNDYIVQEYIDNKKRYGKTIIFADRWFQCVYLKEKLIDRGIKADAVYSQIDADPGSSEARNQKASSSNGRIFDAFKYGRGKYGLDVLINVRMLTEGADVPSVRTVFLTRQTTSPILMTQMIGRALRGKKAGGGDEANIVLFMDEWKRLIDWATPTTLEGETAGEKHVRGYYPLEFISIKLVEELTRQINSPGNFAPQPFAALIPLGWYQTEIVVATDDKSEETQSFIEFVIAYDETKQSFENFIDSFLSSVPKGWDNECLASEWIQENIAPWVKKHFGAKGDRIGNGLEQDLGRIARHIAQTGTKPHFHAFDERDLYDMDALANKRFKFSPDKNEAFLNHEFGKDGSLWKVFYKSYRRFKDAFYLSTARIGEAPPEVAPRSRPTPLPPRRREPSEEIKQQVKGRDGRACLCCGASGKGVRLEIDHIVPFGMGGDSDVENLQTLCTVCNGEKGVNEVSFRRTATLVSRCPEIHFLSRHGSEDLQRSLTRVINFFYRCRAVARTYMHTRRNGQFYSHWQIELYEGNNPDWLIKHKRALLSYIRDECGFRHVRNITIYGPK